MRKKDKKKDRWADLTALVIEYKPQHNSTNPNTLHHASIFDAHVVDRIQRRKTIRKTILHLLQVRYKQDAV